ncbi:MAG TPA: hypothetical protein VK638_28525 [Edaphobacter sp.]|nr:hypothetical protein [Edaphobacter sp.]
MKTAIEVVHNRFAGARLNLKRSDGQCLSLDCENEAIITNASGKTIENIGQILDADDFLHIAAAFTAESATVVSIERPVTRELAVSV